VTPGGVMVPQGSALNLAGGLKLLRGKVEFARLA